VATNGTVTPGDWVGRLIDRRFPLFEWLGSAESGELFRTELPGPESGSPTQKAAIRLVPAEIEGAQVQFDDWAQAEGISHPHLLRIFESGHGRIDENEFLYVVMELPEETLAQVLPTRTLTTSEAGEMLAPLLDALAYLHAKGLVHGHLAPANILVAGDRLKLSADALQQSGQLRKLQRSLRIYDAPEIAQGHLSPASDVWSLGVTLVEALTQLPPMWNSTQGGDPSVPRFMPEPFAEIARKCLRVDPAERASLAELEAIFRTPAVRSPSVPLAPPRAAPPPRSAPSPGTATAPLAASVPPAAAPPVAKEPPTPKPEPPELATPRHIQDAFVFDEVQPSRRALRSVEDEGEGPRFRISTPMIVGIAAVVVVLIAALFVRSHKPKPQSAPETQTESAPAGTPAPKPQPQRSTKFPTPTLKGTVAERVMPVVPERASRTIQGKVTVRVRVSVDRSGDVSNATIEPPVPSRYFSNLALQAARKWRFKPAHIDGRPAPSTWNLRFDFRRGKTDVNPVEVNP